MIKIEFYSKGKIIHTIQVSYAEDDERKKAHYNIRKGNLKVPKKYDRYIITVIQVSIKDLL